MGQRHQVYLRTKEKFYNKGNPNNAKPQTFALHHQWLYGHTAIRLLHNFISFLEKDLGDTYAKCNDPDNAFEILKCAYSFDHTTAYYHGVHDVTAECSDDPRNGDNNNGITVIDYEDGKIKYCFLSVGHLECLHESVYDPYYSENEEDSKKPLTYKNFEPIDVVKWIELHYGKDWNDGSPDCKEIERLINFVKQFEVLSVQRLAKIFPKMVSNNKEDGLYVTPNSIDFILDNKKEKVKKKKTVRKKSATALTA